MYATDDIVISNEKISPKKLKAADKIITEMQQELMSRITKGCGPFMAAIYDTKGNLIAKEVNTVVRKGCSHHHAEMNAIAAAERKLKTYDLSPYKLKMYITAEPCIMCLGGILWSGIKEIYYGVPSKQVEKILEFDEGFKPHWFDEFKKCHITVYGHIAVSEGIKVLKEYIKDGDPIYKPKKR